MLLPEIDALIQREPSGCWLWTGELNGGGYGVFRKRMAHRLVYKSIKGEFEKHLEIDHLCRVRRCVNPDHLEPVTRSENHRRGLAAGFLGRIHAAKTHCPRGHEYNEDNTSIRHGKDGHTRRICRECGRLKNSIGAWRHKPLRQVDHDAIRLKTEELRNT